MIDRLVHHAEMSGRGGQESPRLVSPSAELVGEILPTAVAAGGPAGSSGAAAALRSSRAVRLLPPLRGGCGWEAEWRGAGRGGGGGGGGAQGGGGRARGAGRPPGGGVGGGGPARGPGGRGRR